MTEQTTTKVVTNRIAEIGEEIQGISNSLENHGQYRSEILSLLNARIGTSFTSLTEEMQGMMKKLAFLNAELQGLSERRRELRAERNRLRNTFTVTEDELKLLQGIVMDALNRDPHNELLNFLSLQLHDTEEN